jgi:hypothetical protein
MEALTSYDNPLSVESALTNSLDDLLQSSQQTNHALGFGRTESTQ